MAAPTLQAEGSQNQVTTGNLTLTLPTHQTNDILICTVLAWLPSTVGSLAAIPDLADWTKAAFVQFPVTPDGEIALFWRRATASGTTNPAFTRGASWDTGTDGIYAGRAYVIRGCATTGTPWDELDPTVALTGANGSCDAVTVSGVERTVIQFHAKTDDFSTAPTITGWSPGTASEDTTGTDSSFRTFRQENVASSTTADASTVEAPAAGAYVFFGVSFKPSVTGAALGAFTFGSPASGVGGTPGVALAAVTFGSTAVGVPGIVGQGVAAFTFGAAALGVGGTPGIALGAYAFTGDATGIGEAPSVEGQAAGAFTFGAPAAGLTGVLGQAVAVLAFGGTSSGAVTVTGSALTAVAFGSTAAGVGGTPGQAVSPFVFGATAVGVPGVVAVGLGSYAFTAAAAGAPPGGSAVEGQAATGFVFTASASAVVGHDGAALGGFTFPATAAGTPGVVGSGTATLLFVATAAGLVIETVVHPPDTGDITQPDTGTISQPSGGVTVRPDDGLILRPNTGTITVPVLVYP